MAQWQILDKDGVPLDTPNFDDGLLACPGDEDFSTDAVKGHVKKGEGFNYVGRSPQAHADKEAADLEAAKAEAFAETVEAVAAALEPAPEAVPDVEEAAAPAPGGG